MAIYLTDKDGSDQHFDTYAEFEQAMVLMSRIGGNKVPQDLLDEVSAKYGVKEPKPLQAQIDGKNFESAFRKAVRDVGEELDKLSKDRTPVSDECENPEEDTKFEVGDKVRVVSAEDGTGTPFHGFEIGSIVTVTDLLSTGRIDATDGDFSQVLFREHCENIEDTIESPTEFRTGDIVRATEDVVGFGGHYVACNAGELLEVQTGGSGAMCLVKDSWKNAYVSENLDNIELVCRKEDRKDIEL